MSAICPHCGYDLQREQLVADGRFVFVPGHGLFVDEQRLKVPKACHELLGALIRSNGRTLTALVISDRLDTNVRDPANLVAVYVCRIRRTFARIGVPCPVETVLGFGLRWNPDHDSRRLEAA